MLDLPKTAHGGGMQSVEALPCLRPAKAPARFECWTVAEAHQLAKDLPSMRAGFDAGYTGARCPGPRRSGAYRLGWQMGAIAARRVPVPAWMLSVVAQAENGCAASA